MQYRALSEVPEELELMGVDRLPGYRLRLEFVDGSTVVVNRNDPEFERRHFQLVPERQDMH